MTTAEVRIQETDGCRIVFGSTPMSLLPQLLKGMHKNAVMDSRAAMLLGASMVMGKDEDIQRLIDATPRRQVPEPWAEKIGAGACKWAAEAEIGNSSVFALQRLTGFNAYEWYRGGRLDTDASPEHPRDPADLRRIRLLFDAQPNLLERLPELAVTPQWKALVAHWDEICETMDAETPQWRNPPKGARSSKTYELLKELVDKAKPSSPSP